MLHLAEADTPDRPIETNLDQNVKPVIKHELSPRSDATLATSMSAMTLDSESSQQSRLDLLSLPDEIQRTILAHLLDASALAHTITKADLPGFETRYKLETAVLQTCKALSETGSTVLRNNHFILISSPTEAVQDVMSRMGVPAWTRKLAKFKGYSLHVHITQTGTVSPGAYMKIDGKLVPLVKDKQKHFWSMICFQDLQKLVFAIRLLNEETQKHFDMKFKMQPAGDGAQLGIGLQKRLLDPFTMLGRSQLQCKIMGAVDKGLAARINRLLAPQVSWSRIFARDLRDMVVYRKRIADIAFGVGNLRIARQGYKLTQAFIFDKGQELTMRSQCDDDVFMRNMSCISTTCAINFNLTGIKLMWKERKLRAMELRNEVHGYIVDNHASLMGNKHISDEAKGLAQLCFFAAHLVTMNMSAAEGAMQRALRFSQQVPSITACAKVYFRIASKGRRCEEENIDKVMACLPNEPLTQGDKLDVSYLPVLEEEHYMLKFWGYEGTMAEDRIKHKEGWSVDSVTRLPVRRPFDKFATDKKLEVRKKNREEAADETGRLPSIIIGPARKGDLGSGPGGVLLREQSDNFM